MSGEALVWLLVCVCLRGSRRDPHPGSDRQAGRPVGTGAPPTPSQYPSKLFDKNATP
jgi:hypothetical protein